MSFHTHYTACLISNNHFIRAHSLACQTSSLFVSLKSFWSLLKSWIFTLIITYYNTKEVLLHILLLCFFSQLHSTTTILTNKAPDWSHTTSSLKQTFYSRTLFCKAVLMMAAEGFQQKGRKVPQRRHDTLRLPPDSLVVRWGKWGGRCN